ncbi:SET domain-containing protein [Hymenopellis radicata]|nr:SET domain-containing protein [Hymenopellis radicata]
MLGSNLPVLENMDEIRSGQQFKLPFGNIDGLKYDPDALPEGYSGAAHLIQEFNGNNTYEGVHLIITRQPTTPPNATLESHPDGWTECLVPPVVKRTILSTPGFPAPLDRVPPAHRIGPSPSGGMGMFATRPLEAGDLIFAERAMIIATGGVYALQGADHLKGIDYLRALLIEAEKTLEVPYGRLLPEWKEAFMNLSNSHENDGSGPLMGRLRTNGFTICGLSGAREAPYSGVFDVLSRINHSCGPNTTRHFDMKTFALKLYAVRNIKEGEEITTSYCELDIPTSQRQKSLAPYGFQCACPHCCDPSSDARRARIRKEFDSSVNAERLSMWLENTRLPDDLLIKETEEALKVMEREGMTGSAYYSANLMHMCAIYNALDNDVATITKYKARLLKLWIAADGLLQTKLEMFKMIVVPLQGRRKKKSVAIRAVDRLPSENRRG